MTWCWPGPSGLRPQELVRALRAPAGLLGPLWSALAPGCWREDAPAFRGSQSPDAERPTIWGCLIHRFLRAPGSARLQSRLTRATRDGVSTLHWHDCRPNSHTRGRMKNEPRAPLRTTLMSGPSGRSSIPIELYPGGRPRGEAQRTAGGAQAISAPAKVAHQSS